MAVAGAGVVLLGGCSRHIVGVPAIGTAQLTAAVSSAATSTPAATSPPAPTESATGPTGAAGSTTAAGTPALTLHVNAAEPMSVTELSTWRPPPRPSGRQTIAATVTSQPSRQLSVASKADPSVIAAMLGGARKLSWQPVNGSGPATPNQSESGADAAGSAAGPVGQSLRVPSYAAHHRPLLESMP